MVTCSTTSAQSGKTPKTLSAHGSLLRWLGR